MGLMADDPAWLPLMLDSTVRYPTDSFGTILLESFIGRLPAHWRRYDVKEDDPDRLQRRADLRRECDERLVAELTRLAAEGHPERERMLRVIEALKTTHDGG